MNRRKVDAILVTGGEATIEGKLPMGTWDKAISHLLQVSNPASSLLKGLTLSLEWRKRMDATVRCAEYENRRNYKKEKVGN